MKNNQKILLLGANGQIGTELVAALYKKHGKENVVFSDIRKVENENDGQFEIIDVTKKEQIEQAVEKYNITTIYHLAAMLSATGEKNPQACWHINMTGLHNVLEIAREKTLYRIFCPSSMAAFGPTTPTDNVPQETILEPTSIYGVTKVAGELLCNYYFEKFNVDVRGLRYPGIISNKALPGGGTTDYAVQIYYDAIEKGHFECFVNEETRLPMMYMDDCVRATIELMDAPLENLKHHANYNLAGISFTAKELEESVKKYIPKLTVEYKPDFRQAIADSWPKSIDDTSSQEEWSWKCKFDLDAITKDMLEVLGKKLNKAA